MLLTAWTFFVNNVLTQPAYMIGLIVLIGYLLLREPWYETLGGTLKAIVGYLILSTGSGGLTNAVKPILYGLGERFGIQAAIIDPYNGQNAVQAGVEANDPIVGGQAFSQVMLLMAIAFVLNLLLVRLSKITKLRAVFTTGNVQIQQASTAFWLMLFALPALRSNSVLTLICMSIVLSLYWAVGSNLLVRYTQELTDGAGFTVAHQQIFGTYISATLAEKLKKHDEKKAANNPNKKESIWNKSIEDIELPGWTQMFNDNMVCTSILMLIFFGILLALLGKPYLVSIGETKEGASFFFYILGKSLGFAASLAILQLGVRTMVAELTHAFKGISDKVLPGAVPGVDCAVTFSFGSPNAVTIGFIAGAIGEIIAILCLVIFKSPTLIIAGFIPMFFDNAVIGVFCNNRGGLKGAILFPFISGLLQVFGSALIATWVGLAQYGGYLGMWDWAVVWPIFTVVMKFLGWAGFALVVIFLLLIPQLQYRKDPEHYFLETEDWEEYKRQKGLE